MGTDKFREDVSEALKKFIRNNPNQTPQVMKVNYQDAANWCTAERSKQSPNDFVASQAQAYVNTIPWQKAVLRCPVELLNVDDNSPTRFE